MGRSRSERPRRSFFNSFGHPAERVARHGGSVVNVSVQILRGEVPPGRFYPLPHPKHSEGGFVFPHFLIDEIKRQEGRDLTRFDVDYDIPDHFLPEFPPAIYLNQRTDLDDVSQGKLVTIANYYDLFNGIPT